MTHRLGKYRILEKVGAGGMAEVYRARRTDDSGVRDYAIKQLSADLSRDKHLVQMFIDEARLAAQLNHPSIVELIEYGTDDDGRAVMVMEFIDGRDLRWCLAMAARAQYWLPVEFSLSVARDLCGALGYAHRAADSTGRPLEIVHRDVSHSNVFISSRGETKLADFGIARAEGRESKTRTGLVKGKLGYLSPEQVRAEPLDGRSDLFSASVVLWELLTQRRMFVGETEFKTMVAVCSAQRRPPSDFRPGLPTSVDDLVLRGVAIPRDERYPDAEAMQVAIEEVADELGLTLGQSIVAEVLKYLEDCSRAFASDGAPQSEQELLSRREVTPTPNAGVGFSGGTVPFVDPGPSATFAHRINSAADGEAVVLPSLEARHAVTQTKWPDPILLRRNGMLQSFETFGDFFDAIVGRLEADDAISSEGETWADARKLVRLAGLQAGWSLDGDQTQWQEGVGPSLVAVLTESTLNGFTGKLLVERDGQRYAVLLDGGAIRGVISGRPEQQLLVALASTAAIEPASLGTVFGAILQTREPIDIVLTERYLLAPPRLAGQQIALTHEIISDLLAVGAIRYQCTPTEGWPGHPTLFSSALEPVLDAGFVAWPDCTPMLAGYGDGLVKLNPGFPLVARALQLSSMAVPVIRAFGQGGSLGAVIDRFDEGSNARRLAEHLGVVFVESGAVRIE